MGTGSAELGGNAQIGGDFELGSYTYVPPSQSDVGNRQLSRLGAGAAPSTAGEALSVSDMVTDASDNGVAPHARGTSGYGAAPEFEQDLVVQALQNQQRILLEEEIRNFSMGMITDSSPMVEISNASSDEQNIEIIEDGSRARRRGLSYEASFARSTANHTNVVSYLWYHAEDGNPYLAVLRPSSTNLSTATMVVNTHDASDPVTLSTVLDSNTTAATYYTSNRSASEWGGDLYLPQGSESTFDDYCGVAMYYNGATLTAVHRPVFIRDYWGVDDGYAISDRPASLTANHLYNLVNQGWTYEDIESFHTTMSLYPSNGDMPWYGKLGNNYQQEELNTIPAPNGAPKGSVIISAQSFDRTASSLVVDAFAAQGALLTSNISTDDDQSLTWKFCAEFGGRIVWAAQRKNTYARTGSSNDQVPDMETILFFSRSVTNQAKAVSATDPAGDSTDTSTAFSCYSVVDPTSEFFEATSADGGFYSIPEVGKIMGMKAVGGALVLLADNGVWVLAGAGGVFDPLNSVIKRVGNVGCESEKSIVVARNMVFFKGLDGIYSIVGEEGSVVTRKPSNKKIDVWLSQRRGQFQDAIYDPVNSEVRWLVHKGVEPGATNWAVTGNELRQEELIYNVAKGTFTKNRFPNVTLTVSAAPTATAVTSGTYIAGYVAIPTPVVVNLPDRNDGTTADEDVTRYTPVDLRRSTISFKYLIVDSLGYTFADYTADTYTDFTTTANEEMPGYLITYYDTDGSSGRRKQVGHITTMFYRTELGVEDPGGGYVAANQGSCLIDYYWDGDQRTPNENSTRRQEAYRLNRDYTISGASDPFDYGQAIITTKTKLRGRGRTLQLEFRTSTDKDLQLIGYSITKKTNRRSR